MECDRLPVIGDRARAERGLARWRDLASRCDGAELGAFVAAAADDPDHGRLLEAIFSNSPYLSESLLAHPDVLHAFVHEGPDAAFAGLCDGARAIVAHDRFPTMRELRIAKRRTALLVALADITGAWELEAVTGALTSFADLAVGIALGQVVHEAARRGELEGDGDDLAGRCGIFVLGMGKHGARELNYSSDIDLIVLFDDARLPYRGRESPMALCVRMTRALVYLLEERTREGYVFRTDLRLRPHPAGQPLALSVEAAENYYERHGQNWERAAHIKARVVAGDMEVGNAYLAGLQPYVWRRSLDFAAIADIHSIKRQINAFHGFGRIRVRGHDIKVGRGGIREIEFFAQTQQLILGGRVPELRTPATCKALAALVESRWLDAAIADDLVSAYRFLRRVEHRLQMVADKQTHALPQHDDAFAGFAAFMGYGEAEALERDIRTALETVERHYAALFEASPDLGAGGSLVFTGTDDHPGTLETLAGLGFSDPPAVARRIREWHHGHVRATRSARARELLTELLPGILEALGRQADIDRAFALFDEFVTSLPSGVQLFSLFRANQRLLRLVADMMGAAPRLARHLSANVDLFDAMLTPDFFEPLHDRADLEAELGRALQPLADLQDVLDATRRWTHARQFQAGLQVLLGLADGERAAIALTDIAEVVIQKLLPAVTRWLEAQNGRIDQGAFVVLGLGKLGSRELTIGSDLDLIFVFDGPAGASSDGEKPLRIETYYGRLSQRLVSALTAQTPEGKLFEIDTRLRPSGNVGPVACSLENFERYQMETAKVWEHQALTRARVVAGDPELARKVHDAVRAAVTLEREPETVAAEVRAMRARIFKEHGDEDPWNLKHVRGGLVDIEFTAQALQLIHGPAHPETLDTNTIAAIGKAAEASVLDSDDAGRLVAGAELHHRLQAVLRLSLDDRLKPETAPEGLRAALVRAAEPDADAALPRMDFATLCTMLIEAQAAVRAIFDRLTAASDDQSEGVAAS